MLWFNFILCFKLIIIHYHTPKKRKIKYKPRIKFNLNIYMVQSKFELASRSKHGTNNDTF